MKLKESWRHWTADHARSFLRTGPEGKDHLSRQTAVRLLRGMSSVLDVGCGTGVMFELIRDCRLELDYLGIDVTETFLEVARNLYPLRSTNTGRPFGLSGTEISARVCILTA